jgi:hypothetical protein
MYNAEMLTGIHSDTEISFLQARISQSEPEDGPLNTKEFTTPTDNDTEGSSKRLPMHDISNKLHAMVDEFVSNLSSKCDSLATKVTDKNHEFGEVNVGLTTAMAQRSINRTPSDILQGLKKPRDIQSTFCTETDGSLQSGQRRQSLDACSIRTSNGGECMAILMVIINPSITFNVNPKKCTK